jgi:hypothetical protein
MVLAVVIASVWQARILAQDLRTAKSQSAGLAQVLAFQIDEPAFQVEGQPWRHPFRRTAFLKAIGGIGHTLAR